ncbi:MAG: hypothetical protein GX456_20350 [Verrucomicrobia bacterium]|nr:hypothetical protein [Verrucomicrobiota bacterium]
MRHRRKGLVRQKVDRLGAGKNAALLHALEKATAPGARPSPAASIRRPIVHLFQSRKPVARSLTGWGRARMPALLHALEKATTPGARPSPAASTRRPILHLLQSRKSVARSLTGWGSANYVPVPMSGFLNRKLPNRASRSRGAGTGPTRLRDRRQETRWTHSGQKSCSGKTGG